MWTNFLFKFVCFNPGLSFTINRIPSISQPYCVYSPPGLIASCIVYSSHHSPGPRPRSPLNSHLTTPSLSQGRWWGGGGWRGGSGWTASRLAVHWPAVTHLLNLTTCICHSHISLPSLHSSTYPSSPSNKSSGSRFMAIRYKDSMFNY